MLNNEAQAASQVILLNPVSAANTAAATSGWKDISQYEGDVEIIVQTGAVTGSITWTIEDATDSGGTAGATFTGANEGAFAAGAANQIQRGTFKKHSCRGWVRVVGTIVTGPVLVASSLQARPKNV